MPKTTTWSKHFAYLIDQQASERLVVQVEGTEKTYSPISVIQECAIVNYRNRVLKLSREQAIKLGKLLLEAAKQCPKVSANVEYPGYVLK